MNTIASVLKKFLRKVPGGIFGPENEADLFTIINMETEDEKKESKPEEGEKEQNSTENAKIDQESTWQAPSADEMR